MDLKAAVTIVRRAEAIERELLELGPCEGAEHLAERCRDLISKAHIAAESKQIELLPVLETIVDDLRRASRRLAVGSTEEDR